MAGRNSPVVGENGITASQEEINALTRNMRENFMRDINRPKVNLHDTEDVKQAIYNYLLDCEQSGKRPANMGLYRALDLSRQDVNDVITGKNKSKVSPECIDIIKKAISMLAEYREQLGIQGKLNPVTLIFWQKNYDRMTDSQVIEIQSNKHDAMQLTQDEITKRIPVYSDAEQDTD